MSQNDAFWQNDRKINRYDHDEVRSNMILRIFTEIVTTNNAVSSLVNEINDIKSSPNMC